MELLQYIHLQCFKTVIKFSFCCQMRKNQLLDGMNEFIKILTCEYPRHNKNKWLFDWRMAGFIVKKTHRKMMNDSLFIQWRRF